MTDQEFQLHLREIDARIANINRESDKWALEMDKIRQDLRWEPYKVLAYVVATFTAAFFLAFKVAGVI